MVNYLSEYLVDAELTTHSGATTSVHGFDASGKVVPQVHGTARHTGTIGTESQVTFATTGGHHHTGADSAAVAWSNISGHPTVVSVFSNDSGFKTGYCTYCGYCTFCTYCTYCTYCDCNCDCGGCGCK